ncbi:MAG: N-acetylneuraminate synthase family protein [Synergistaceae bacterium]|nr:N-acetylneuraminate synthase family protein [Synergistaceae bacterium]
MDIAHRMIELLGAMKLFGDNCRIDVIKFQKREPKELLSPQEYNAPHPNPNNSYGKTYGEHREYLEFSQDQHKQLKDWCEEAGCEYSTSVWELTSARKIAALNPKLIKIPSASNLDFDMLGFLADEYGGEIHISLGMTSHAEEDKIFSFFERKNRLSDLVLYSCTSGYPVPFKDVCVREVSRIREKFGAKIKAVGFSGHHLGIAADIAALALGAEYFERHFTLDRTWKGTDHAASLEPDGIRKLARDLRNTAEALSYKQQEILPIEQVQRDKLKRKI